MKLMIKFVCFSAVSLNFDIYFLDFLWGIVFGAITYNISF